MAEGSFSSFVEEKLGKFPHFLIYTVLEWLEIILIFIDGIFAFVSNEFARFFELRIPCLLCTRIDHLLVTRDSSFYYNESICEVHKKDVSSLAFCNVHKKLCDISNMCQGCLLSFATERGMHFDKYKLGISHKDVDFSDDDDEKKSLMKASAKSGEMEVVADDKSGIMNCCCCGEGSGDLKLIADHENVVVVDGRGARAATVPLLTHINEYAPKTTPFSRANSFFGIPLSDSVEMSPRWNARGNRKLSIEKLDLLLESNDSSEENGDLLSCLKRQILLDREALSALHMELDEERGAAETAASNAMAMITRLQAEKATVQMEASQYQRMAEEQAEYGQEALQVMEEMLCEREEEINVVRYELELYREKYGFLKLLGSEICEVDAEDYQKSPAMSEKSECGGLGVDEIEHPFESDDGMGLAVGIPEESPLGFDVERNNLLGLLKNLEKKINAPSDEMSNSAELHEDEERDQNRGTDLTQEVLLFRESLRAIEADSSFLKQAAMTLQRGNEGTKLLVEIAQHLRSLRQPIKTPLQVQDA